MVRIAKSKCDNIHIIVVTIHATDVFEFKYCINYSFEM